MHRLALSSALIVLLSPTAALAQRWERLGPASALPCTIAAGAAAPGVLYAGFPQGGVFRSGDRGATWSFAGAGIGLQSSCVLAVDPADSARLFVLAPSGIFRSRDGGRTWSLATAGLPVPITFLDDLQGSASLVFAGPRRRDLVAVYPGGVFASHDGGATWVRRGRGLTADVLRLAADPGNPEVIYGLTGQGFVKTVDGGASWFAPRPGLRFAPFSSPEDVVVSARSILVASFDDGVLRSRDGGAHWTRLGLGGARPLRLWIDHATQRLYLAALVLGPASQRQTFVSDDDGSSWSPGASELRFVEEISAAGPVVYAATLEEAVLRSTDDGARWSTAAAGIAAGSFTSIVADPQAHDVLYASGEGFWRSLDRGRSWQRPTTSAGMAAGSGAGRLTVDLLGESPSSLAFLPTAPPTLVGGVSAGVALSQDRGETWTLRRGLDCNTIERVWVVPATPPVLYVAGEALDAGCVLQDPDYCDAARSADLGSTWSCRFTPRDTSLIAVDPLGAALYARQFPAGLSRSLDDGRSFAPVTGARRARVLAFDPRHAGVVYAGTDLGVARSGDGGATWARLDFPVAAPVAALALGPEEPAAAVYAATATTLYRSRDGGATWAAVGSGLGEVTLDAILIDPDDPATLYLATTGGSVMRLTQTD